MQASKVFASLGAMAAVGLGLCAPSLSSAAGATASSAAHHSAKPAPAGAAWNRTAADTGVQLGGPAKILHHVKVVTHGVRIMRNTAYSSNWSGYVATNEKYTFVYGQWVVPHANCSFFELSHSSTWVGLDGWGNGTVEQLGTDSGCEPVLGGSYDVWWEMYPANSVSINEPVSPGDTVDAWVYVINNGTQYELVISDQTKGWEWWTVQNTPSPAPQDASAEWITEAPTECYIIVGCSRASLTNFGTTTFQDAYAEGNGNVEWLNSFPNTPIDMDSNNTLEAAVGGLSAPPTSFTDWWYHS